LELRGVLELRRARECALPRRRRLAGKPAGLSAWESAGRRRCPWLRAVSAGRAVSGGIAVAAVLAVAVLSRVTVLSRKAVLSRVAVRLRVPVAGPALPGRCGPRITEVGATRLPEARLQRLVPALPQGRLARSLRLLRRAGRGEPGVGRRRLRHRARDPVTSARSARAVSGRVTAVGRPGLPGRKPAPAAGGSQAGPVRSSRVPGVPGRI
jgi:hypothetical protein